MHGLVLFAGLIFFLWLGRGILIPLLMATFLWYLINAIAAYYRKIMPFRAEHTRITLLARVFDWIANILSGATLVLMVYMFVTQIQPMFRELISAMPDIQYRITMFGHYISDTLGIHFDESVIPDMTTIVSHASASAASVLTAIGMIIIYMLFMFVEQSTFNQKFRALFPNRNRSRKMRYILDSIDENMKKYMFVKTLVSAVTGVVSYIWLYQIGLEFAGVWAFIVFITSYIPTIGAIVACGLPILYAFISASTPQLPILTAGGLISIQILFGNILEPKLMGKTLNLSTLAILINMVFWGMIWGPVGMFFSVPLLVATFIITAQFDSLRWIAILLSADGNIPDKRDDD